MNGSSEGRRSRATARAVTGGCLGHAHRERVGREIGYWRYTGNCDEEFCGRILGFEDVTRNADHTMGARLIRQLKGWQSGAPRSLGVPTEPATGTSSRRLGR